MTMKLSWNIFFFKSFHLSKILALYGWVADLKLEQYNVADYIASLVKVVYRLPLILGSYSVETTQNPWKLIASCSTRTTFEFIISQPKMLYLFLKLDSNIIVIRNGKIVWKQGPYCWYFHLNLKHLGWPYREYIKTVKYGGFCEKLHSENEFVAVLATFCCYDYGANASEAVQKIATDQKEYLKSSSFVIIYWIAKIYLSINNSEKSEKKVGY